MSEPDTKPLYSEFHLCPMLTPEMKCIRLRKYNHNHTEGDVFTELFHEHCPRHRISQDASIEMLKALVLRYEQVGAPYILRCYLNKRGREPQPYDPFQITVKYPEPGVLRVYCGTDIQAWIDTVISPRHFRQRHNSSNALS